MIFQFQFYNEYGLYYWGLGKFLSVGKFANSEVFSLVGPGLSAFIIAFLLNVFPNFNYEFFMLGSIIIILIAGPFIFRLAYKDFNFSFKEILFYFFFAMSGFYVVDYLIYSIAAPQVLAYILLPLFPALLFSKNKNTNITAAILLLIIFLIHPATGFIISLVTAASYIWKSTRKSVWLFSLILGPIIILKVIHTGLIVGGLEFSQLPLNDVLNNFMLSTGISANSNEFNFESFYQLILSGVPIFFWIIILPFLNKKTKSPIIYWYLTFSIILLFAYIGFAYWSELFGVFNWPRERYLGFLWLSFGLTLPFGMAAIKGKIIKKMIIVLALPFIVFQFGMAFYRLTIVDEGIESRMNFIQEIKEYISEADGPILYMASPDLVTMSYSYFAPHDIYFMFPTVLEDFKNRREPITGYYRDFKPIDEEIENSLKDFDISLAILSKGVPQLLRVMDKSPNYELVITFAHKDDVIYVYDLKTNP